MTFRAKIIASYALIIALMVVFSAVAITNNAKVGSLYEEIADKHFQMTRITQELTYRNLQRESGLQKFLLTGKTRYLVAYDENTLPVKVQIRKARELYPGNSTYSSLIRRYEALITDWEENIAEAQKEKRQQLDYGLIDLQAYNTSIADIDKKGRSIFAEMKAIENELLNTVEKDMSEKAGLAREVAASTKRLLLIIAFTGILMTSVLSALLSQRITSAFGKVVRAARVISTGDLSYRIPVMSTRDELEVLADSFNNMAEKLEENIRALKESEEKYSTLVEYANDGIAIIHHNRFVFASRRFCEIIGYGQDEIIGMESLSIVAEDSVEYVKERYTKRLRGEDVPNVHEAQFVCKNGDLKYLEVSAAVIEYKNEKSTLVVYRDIAERKQYQENLKRLSEQLLSTQEEERKRISQELHDEIGQALSAMNINVEILEKGMGRSKLERQQRLEDLKKLILKTIDDIHRISYNLRPYLLDNFGLIPALRWYSETFQERTGVTVTLCAEGKWQDLDPSLETIIYRVAQEALTNVAKHAEANRVLMGLEHAPACIRISIEDDGKGFDTAHEHGNRNFSKGGLGIFGIRERLSTLNGTFAIESALGGGTRLLIEIPVEPSQPKV
ncbi:MAG: Signal transduction histidine-protein kinase/phosphatase DegS [Syntrophorhabdaceae bacterium PtaU1.Bin034]|nr:MAG: Signal transduction histidine-protein kinase/phosphatase DegS [Syntrophorhabdaceae bacterium PtaU1.Bin034]